MTDGRSLFATLARMDPGWGIVEYNATDLKQPAVLRRMQQTYHTLRDLFNFDGSQIAMMAWNGSNGRFAGQPGYVAYTAWRNTPGEEALVDFLVDHADLPRGARLWTFGTARHADDDGWSLERGHLAPAAASPISSRDDRHADVTGRSGAARRRLDTLVLGLAESRGSRACRCSRDTRDPRGCRDHGAGSLPSACSATRRECACRSRGPPPARAGAIADRLRIAPISTPAPRPCACSGSRSIPATAPRIDAATPSRKAIRPRRSSNRRRRQVAVARFGYHTRRSSRHHGAGGTDLRPVAGRRFTGTRPMRASSKQPRLVVVGLASAGVLVGCFGGDDNTVALNTLPAGITNIVGPTSYNGTSDDLLTAGLGKTGLAGAAPGFADPLQPHVGRAAPARHLHQLPGDPRHHRRRRLRQALRPEHRQQRQRHAGRRHDRRHGNARLRRRRHRQEERHASWCRFRHTFNRRRRVHRRRAVVGLARRLRRDRLGRRMGPEARLRRRLHRRRQGHRPIRPRGRQGQPDRRPAASRGSSVGGEPRALRLRPHRRRRSRRSTRRSPTASPSSTSTRSRIRRRTGARTRSTRSASRSGR